MLHFRESWHSGSPSLRAQINFYLHFPYFLNDLDQIWCGDTQTLILKIHEISELWCIGKSVKNISALIFYILLQIWVKSPYKLRNKCLRDNVSFMKTCSVKDTGLLYLMVEWVYIHTIYIYNTILVKLCTRYMHMILSVSVSSVKKSEGAAALLQWGYLKIHLCIYRVTLR